ncbi:MAG: hypothetical protein ACFCU3_08900, partial [Verrucomicrobiales bacterium]
LNQAASAAGRESSRQSLTVLLSEEETRDLVLDDEVLIQAILERQGALLISPFLFFYLLTRKALRGAGIESRSLSDYVGALLSEFSHVRAWQTPGGSETSTLYLSDLLQALQKTQGRQAFLLQAHIGNLALFLSGLFHERVEKRRQRGAPSLAFYEQLGQRNFALAAQTPYAKECDLHLIYEELADTFPVTRQALNRLSDELLQLDEGPRCSFEENQGRVA